MPTAMEIDFDIVLIVLVKDSGWHGDTIQKRRLEYKARRILWHDEVGTVAG